MGTIEKGSLTLLPLRSEMKSAQPVAEDAVLKLVEETMHGAADVYAVLEYAVAFGRYEAGAIALALADDAAGLGRLAPLPLPYVRELRIFQEARELRIVRSKDGFRWRLRQDFAVEAEQGQEIHVLDEVHKIWGASERSEMIDASPWSLLTSQRGSAIWAPGDYKPHGEVGLRIRNYIEFARAEAGNGIVHFVDERLLGFAPWPKCVTKEVQ